MLALGRWTIKFELAELLVAEHLDKSCLSDQYSWLDKMMNTSTEFSISGNP